MIPFLMVYLFITTNLFPLLIFLMSLYYLKSPVLAAAPDIPSSCTFLYFSYLMLYSTSSFIKYVSLPIILVSLIILYILLFIAIVPNVVLLAVFRQSSIFFFTIIFSYFFPKITCPRCSSRQLLKSSPLATSFLL